MNNIFKNIILKLTAVSLLVSLLFPHAQNLIHSFEHHHHVIECNDNDTVHLHEVEFDCHFDQLFTTPKHLQTSKPFILLEKISCTKTAISLYTTPFLKNYSLKSIIARGPPTV